MSQVHERVIRTPEELEDLLELCRGWMRRNGQPLRFHVEPYRRRSTPSQSGLLRMWESELSVATGDRSKEQWHRDILMAFAPRTPRGHMKEYGEMTSEELSAVITQVQMLALENGWHITNPKQES